MELAKKSDPCPESTTFNISNVFYAKPNADLLYSYIITNPSYYQPQRSTKRSVRKWI